MKWLLVLLVCSSLTGIGLYGYQRIVVRPKQEATLVVLEAQCKTLGHKGFKAVTDWKGGNVELYCIRQDDSLELIKAAPETPAGAVAVPVAPPADSNTGIVETARTKWAAKCKAQGGKVSIVQEGTKNKAYCLVGSRMDFLGSEDR